MSRRREDEAMPIAEAARRNWDVVVVGAGHNGLTAAAYVARAGRSVLVLEARERFGGACRLERPFADRNFIVSPCAYVVGLLHSAVVRDLDLHRYGYTVRFIDPHLWCPFDDGTSLALWDDSERNRVSVEALSPHDVEGYLRYEQLFARIRRALRSDGRDTWLGDAPERAEIEDLLDHDRELIEVLFEEPIADLVERHVRDPRLRTALHGQGLIGTWAGPRDRGTAAIHAMHSMGTLEGRAGGWGYVVGGMGRISFALAEAARQAGAVIVSRAPVDEIIPEDGVRLADGTRIRARSVVSNADPRTTLSLLGSAAPDSFAARVAGWRMEGPVLKINCALSALPRFKAASNGDSHRAMVTIARSIDATQEAYERSRRGEPAPRWMELYFHTAYDGSVAPPGKHVISIFAQYVPYRLAEGSWDARRDEIADSAIAGIARFAPDIAACILDRQVLAPPDIEAHVGLSGGHIFQGECLPEQMWSRRFAPRTPLPGVYLCGAATHPGGSVIAANGRNAAMAVLADLSQSTTASASISSR